MKKNFIYKNFDWAKSGFWTPWPQCNSAHEIRVPLQKILMSWDLVQLGRKIKDHFANKIWSVQPWHLLLPIMTPSAFPHTTSYFPMLEGSHNMTPNSLADTSYLPCCPCIHLILQSIAAQLVQNLTL